MTHVDIINGHAVASGKVKDCCVWATGRRMNLYSKFIDSLELNKRID